MLFTIHQHLTKIKCTRCFLLRTRRNCELLRSGINELHKLLSLFSEQIDSLFNVDQSITEIGNDVAKLKEFIKYYINILKPVVPDIINLVKPNIIESLSSFSLIEFENKIVSKISIYIFAFYKPNNINTVKKIINFFINPDNKSNSIDANRVLNNWNTNLSILDCYLKLILGDITETTNNILSIQRDNAIKILNKRNTRNIKFPTIDGINVSVENLYNSINLDKTTLSNKNKNKLFTLNSKLFKKY